MDPLPLFRDWVMSNRLPKVENQQVLFDTISFPIDQPVPYLASKRAPYKVWEILDVATVARLPYSDYLRLIREKRREQIVRREDFDDLSKYFTGRAHVLKRHELSALPQQASSASVLGKRAVGGNELGSSDVMAQLLRNKCSRQQQIVREVGVTGNPLQFSEDAELVSKDKEALALLSGVEEIKEERNQGLLAPEANFKLVADMADQLIKRVRDQANGKISASVDPRKRGSDTVRTGHGLSQGQTRPASDPIIIVPNAPNDLITMANAGDFLEKSHFVGPEERKQRGDKRVKELFITKTLSITGDGTGGTRPVKFKVITNAMALSEPDWQAVVAVFSNGKTWQFQEWKHKTAVDLFSNCFGAVVHYDDEPVSQEVKGWNVTFFKVNKTKRHLDGAAASAFWTQLEEWVRTKKPWVLTSSPPPLGTARPGGAR